MFYKEEILKLISNFKFDANSLKEELLFLVEKTFIEKFYITYHSNWRILKLPDYFEIIPYKMFKSNITHFYESIFSKAYKNNLITLLDYKILMIMIIDLMKGNQTRIPDSELKLYTILCILKAFNKELPKVALLKLYYILLKPEVFIKTILEKEKKKNANITSLMDIEIPAILNMDFIFVAAPRGPYDRNWNTLLNTLNNNYYIKINYEHKSQLSNITERGCLFIEKIIKNNKKISDLYKNAIQLANFFKKSSGKEIERFLKDVIIRDFNKYERGAVL